MITISNKEIRWCLCYDGTTYDEFPSIEDIQKDLDILRRDFEKISPLCEFED
jgi:hypothetical protein